MLTYMEIFQGTIGKDYLETYEQLLNDFPPEKINLKSLSKKFVFKVETYFEELQINWTENLNQKIINNLPSQEEIIAIDLQYQEYLQEADDFLVSVVSEYPSVYTLWEMDRIIQGTRLIYDWHEDGL